MTALSAILRELRFEAAGYNRLELRAPWAIAFEQQGLRGVHIVLEGRCEALLEGASAELGAGDYVITARADPHVLRSIGSVRAPITPASALGRAAVSGKARAGGTGERTLILCGAFVFHEADHPALSALPRLIHVRAEQPGQLPDWLSAFVALLLAESSAAEPGSDVVMARLSDALLARALRAHATQSEERGWLRGLQDPYVAKALTAMHERMRQPWTLASLAKAAGLSRAAFAARFADTMGETPMRYLVRCRMRRAMTLLRDDRTSLAQVAQRVGYGSEAALSTAFKRHTGVAPGAYRRSGANTG